MAEPKEIAERYPQSCPFCTISAAYPHTASPGPDQTSTASRSTDLVSCIPTPSSADPARVDPAAFVVLAAPRVLAFLDILPMTRGHLLVTTREHRGKVEDVAGVEGRDVGE